MLHRTAPRSTRWAAMLLPYVNLLLMMMAGAGLATAARLRWDPSASIPLRLVLPQEYYVLTALLAVAPLALLLLTALSQAGLHGGTGRRSLLIMYAAGMVLLMLCEAAAGAWLVVRAHRFLAHDALVPELRGLLRAGDVLRAELTALLHKLDHFVPLSDVIHSILHKVAPRLTKIFYSEELETLLQEVPSDLPCNVYVGVACVLLCGALQPLAALLGWLASRTGAAPPTRKHDDALLLSSEGTAKMSNMPRCLRPMSMCDKVVEELPLSTKPSKCKGNEHSLRTAPVSRGWQLQPSAGAAGW